MSEVKTLRELRLSVGLNQVQMAKLLNVAPKTIFNAERDSRTLRPDTLDKYILLFNTTYDKIYRGKGEEVVEAKKAAVMERAKLLQEV